MERFTTYLKRNDMNVSLHQTKGVQWLCQIETSGVVINDRTIRSGILADEMGLGKTIQMIGLILENFKLHTLIVLPRALLEQWETICIKTLGHTPLLYHGSNVKHITLQTLYQSPLVITTYGMISKKSLLHQVQWNRTVFDEAHHLRNRTTRLHKQACCLRATHKWLITGTPIQNKLTDFYGLCALLGIPSLYSCHHKDDIVQQLVLRRTKEDVGIQLPELIQTYVKVDWETELEEKIAQDLHGPLKCLNVSHSHVLPQEKYHGLHPFVYIHWARKSCITVDLIKRNNTHTTPYKSKLNKVISLLFERRYNGNSKLVFCQYIQEMFWIKIQLEHSNLRVALLDGRTSSVERKRLLQSNDIDVLVLHIQTGCEGLNLQRFNEIYFVSPHWNPAVEEQSVARCHRIGQTKPVSVFHFHMSPFVGNHGTSMDGYIHTLQDTKRVTMNSLYSVAQ